MLYVLHICTAFNYLFLQHVVTHRLPPLADGPAPLEVPMALKAEEKDAVEDVGHPTKGLHGVVGHVVGRRHGVL